MTTTKNVMKFNTALGDPFYVDVSNLIKPNEQGTMEYPSVDRILTEAIQNLTAQGKPLEAQQLEQLADNHQMFNANRVVGKGALFNALERTKTVIDTHDGTLEVQVAEVNLMASHAGGRDEESCLNCSGYPGLFDTNPECHSCPYKGRLEAIRQALINS